MTLSRRNFLIASATPLLAGADANDAPYNAMGERIGEVSNRSAIIHTRLTAAATRNNQGYRFPGVTRKTPIRDLPRMSEGMRVEELEGACPGKAGRVRLLYGTRADLKGARQTAWAEAKPEHDFTHQFRLDDLQPGAKYFYAVEMRALDGPKLRRGATGGFRSAPAPNQFRPITFCASTCQHDLTRDSASGFLSYEAMRRLAPDFTSMIGDNVYYDSEPPLATTVELARHFWHRTYSLPSLVEYYRNTPLRTSSSSAAIATGSITRLIPKRDCRSFRSAR